MVTVEFYIPGLPQDSPLSISAGLHGVLAGSAGDVSEIRGWFWHLPDHRRDDFLDVLERTGPDQVGLSDLAALPAEFVAEGVLLARVPSCEWDEIFYRSTSRQRDRQLCKIRNRQAH